MADQPVKKTRAKKTVSDPGGGTGVVPIKKTTPKREPSKKAPRKTPAKTTVKSTAKKVASTTRSKTAPKQQEPVKKTKRSFPTWAIFVIVGAVVSVVAMGLVLTALYYWSQPVKAEAPTGNVPEVVQPVVQPEVSQPESPQQVPEVSAPAVEQPQSPIVSQSVGKINLTQGLDLSTPDYAIPLPSFINNLEDWCYNMNSSQRIAAVEQAHGLQPGSLIELTGETCQGFAFNADAMGVYVNDMPLLEGMTYHVHFVDGRIVYFAGDGSNISQHGVSYTDITMRIAAMMQDEIGLDGLLCRPYWNAYAYDALLGITTIPYGYFEANCKNIPIFYQNAPDAQRIQTFNMLLDVAGIDATPMGELDGLWYFYTSLAAQDVTCPEGWACYSTPTVGVNAAWTSFTGKVSNVQAAYLFEPGVSPETIVNYFQSQGVTITSP